MTVHISIKPFAGGLGSTTLALAVARQLSGRIVVFSDSDDVYGLAGVHDGVHMSSYAENVQFCNSYGYSEFQNHMFTDPDYIIWENTPPPDSAAVRIGLVRNDYISLRSAVRDNDASLPVTHWIVRLLPNRVLNIGDCVRVLGASPGQYFIPEDDPALARACDAGLLMVRPVINPTIQFVVDLIKEKVGANA